MKEGVQKVLRRRGKRLRRRKEEEKRGAFKREKDEWK